MWTNWWNENWQGKLKFSEKTHRSGPFSTANLTWPDLGWNPGRRGGKLGIVLETRIYPEWNYTVYKIWMLRRVRAGYGSRWPRKWANHFEAAVYILPVPYLILWAEFHDYDAVGLVRRVAGEWCRPHFILRWSWFLLSVWRLAILTECLWFTSFIQGKSARNINRLWRDSFSGI
jgi:hypothetical protein